MARNSIMDQEVTLERLLKMAFEAGYDSSEQNFDLEFSYQEWRVFLPTLLLDKDTDGDRQ